MEPNVVDCASLPWAAHKVFPEVYVQTLLDGQTGVDLEVKSIRIAPGAEIGVHTHEDSAETFYILSGEGLLCTKDGVKPCHAGVCVNAKPGTVHGVKNTGKGDLRLLAVFTPPTDKAKKAP